MEDHLWCVRRIIGGFLDDEAREVANSQQWLGPSEELLAIGPVGNPVSRASDQTIGSFLELPFDTRRAFEQLDVVVLDGFPLWLVN